MRTRILLDTGPLVAVFNKRDARHVWAAEVFAAIRPPLRTCEAVISEACFLLQPVAGAFDAVLDAIHRGVVEVTYRFDEDVEPVRRMMAKYSDVPMSFADACLVRMSELDRAATIFTLDSDFRRYRRNGRGVIPVLMP